MLSARSVRGRRRDRRARGSGDFDWLLLEGGRPVSPAHPSHDGLELSPDLQNVLTSFDTLLSEEEEEVEEEVEERQEDVQEG